ncbi:MAG TPA: IgGFc-binding protein [Candidatus Kapabacteria bacterium]|nr:IgGFc-binding protein [Candidatus Kapabacteria bacterium]
MKLIQFFLGLLLVEALITIPIFSQMNNEGKEFAICFPKNDDSEKVGAFLNLSLINDNDSVASAQIYTYIDGKTIQIGIPAKQAINVKIDPKYELSTNNGIEQNSILISSNINISVIALSKTKFSTEAYLALPIDMMDTNYIVANISNRDTLNLAQLSIVGIHDSTKIHINTKVKLQDSIIGLLNNQNIYLDKGEVLILSANEVINSDFTGSLISSNYPVSVFASHQRTSIPITSGYLDYIIEQAIPTSLLGQECYFTPAQFPYEKSSVLVRVVSAFDSTVLKIAHIDTIINKSEYIEYKSNVPFQAIANKPVLFAQYGKSARLTNSKGDPFLIYNTPKEQWRNKYSFYNYELDEFTEHWVDIIIPYEGLESLSLDGQNINQATFNQIPNSNLWWASIRVSSGFHKINSNNTFSLNVYGYGTIIGYGYSGGTNAIRMLEKIMDSNQPQLNTVEDCSTQLEITDNKEYDSGIDTVEIIESNNANVSINPFMKGEKLIKIKVELKDEKKDGFAIIYTKDIKGYQRVDTMLLQGFDLSFTLKSSHDTIYYLQNICDSIQITNRSKYTSNFSLYFEDNSKISIPPSFYYITLEAKKDTTIPFCVYSTTYFNYIADKLIIKDLCNRTYSSDLKYYIKDNLNDINSKCEVELRLIIKQDLKDYLNKNSSNSNIVFRIFDLDGSEVFVGTIDKNPSNLSRGIYFIQEYVNNEFRRRYIINLD